MRNLLVFFVALTLSAAYVCAQDAVYIMAFDAKVYFEVPDTTQWMVARDELDTATHKRFLMFKHTPIKDKKGRMVMPVIAMIIDSIPDSSNLVMYSVYKRSVVPYQVTKVLTPSAALYSYDNALGYLGTYTSNKVKHSIVVAHMIYNNLGVEIICDSTTEIMKNVDKDFRAFIKSIHFTEEE